MPPEPSTWTSLASTTGSTARTTNDGQSTLWDLTNDRVRLRLRWSTELGLTLDHLHPTNGTQLYGSPKTPVFSLAWSGPSTLGPRTAVTLIESSAVANDTHVTLSIRIALAPLTVTVNLRCYDNLAVLQQWLNVESTESGVLRTVTPCVLSLATTSVPTLSTVAGVQQQGGWRPDSGRYRSFRLEERPLTEPYIGKSGIRSTWDETPWYAFADLAGSAASPPFPLPQRGKGGRGG